MPTLRNRNKEINGRKMPDQMKRKISSTESAASPVKKKLKLESPLKHRPTSPAKRSSPTKPQIKTEERRDADSSQSDTDLSDVENISHIDYMKRREENIRLNHEFLRQFGIEQARQNLLASEEKKKPSHRGLKKEKVEVALLPRRSSLRLQNKSPEGIDLPPEALISRATYTPYVPEEHLRPPAGPLAMTDYLYKTSTSDAHDYMTKVLASLKTKPIKPSTVELDRYVTQMSKSRLVAERVAKVVPERSFSVAVHPSDTKILVATGDKWGKVGLWDVECNANTDADGVCCYCPHSRPITGLEFPVHSPHKVYTCGYDGSMRCGDLDKAVFDEVYSIAEDEDVLLRNFSWTSPHTMLVSQNDGCVALVDTRTNKTTSEHTYELHNRSLRTVSCHPVQTSIFCTAGVEGTLCIWDLRNVKVKKSSPICILPHGRSINSAYFSPVTGKYILSTSMDDKLTIYDTSTIGPKIKHKKIISHNNHTGRWLTGFRASWHPAREDVFAVGSMNRPREISLFSDEGNKLLSLKDEDYLGSVCSLNALHPSRDIVVGANSSGRLHVFM